MHDVSFQEALLAAQHLIAAVFHHHDRRDFVAESECFVEDGIWNRKNELLKGRAAIIATLELRPASLQTMHAVSNVVVHRLWDHRAEATFYLTTYSYDDGIVHDGSVGLRRLPSVGFGNATLRRQGSEWGIEHFATNDWMFQSAKSPDIVAAG